MQPTHIILYSAVGTVKISQFLGIDEVVDLLLFTHLVKGIVPRVGMPVSGIRRAVNERMTKKLISTLVANPLYREDVIFLRTDA